MMLSIWSDFPKECQACLNESSPVELTDHPLSNRAVARSSHPYEEDRIMAGKAAKVVVTERLREANRSALGVSDTSDSGAGDADRSSRV